MLNKFKQLDEGAIPWKMVVIPLNRDELIDVYRRQTLEVVNLIKEK